MQRSGEDAQEQDESSGQRSSRRKRFSFAGYPSSSAQSGKTSSKRTNVLRKKHDRSDNLTGSQQDIAIAAASDSVPNSQKVSSDRTSATQGIPVKAKNLAIVHPMSAQPAQQSSASKQKSGSNSSKAPQQNSNASKMDKKAPENFDEKQHQKSGAYALRSSHSQPNLATLDRKLNRSTSSKDSRKAANLSMKESNKPEMNLQDGSSSNRASGNANVPRTTATATGNVQMNANPDSSSFVRSNTNVNLLAKSASSVAPFAPVDMTFGAPLAGAESQLPKAPYPHPNANFAMHQNANFNQNANAHVQGVQRPGGLQKVPTAVSSFAPFQNTAQPHFGVIPNGYQNLPRSDGSRTPNMNVGPPYQPSFALPNEGAYPYPARPVPPPGSPQRHSLTIAPSPTQLGNVARAGNMAYTGNNQPMTYAPFSQSLTQPDNAATPYTARSSNAANRNSLQLQGAYPSTETVPSSSSSNMSLPQAQGQYEHTSDTQPFTAAQPDSFNSPRTATAPGRIPLSGDGTIVRNSYAALLRRQSQRIVSGTQQDSQALKQRFMATLSEAAANSTTSTNANMNFIPTTNAALPLGTGRSMSTQSFISDDGAMQPQPSTFGSHSQLDSVPAAIAVAEWRQPRTASGVRLSSDSQLPQSDEQQVQQEQQIVRVVETRRSYSRRKVADRSTAFVVGAVEPLDELDDDPQMPPRDFNAARRPSLPIELSTSFASSMPITIDHEPSGPIVAPSSGPFSVNSTSAVSEPQTGLHAAASTPSFEVRAVRNTRLTQMSDQQPANASHSLASVHAKSASLDRTVPYVIPTASISNGATIGVGIGKGVSADIDTSEPNDFKNTRLALSTQPVTAPTSWKAKTFTATPKPYQLNPVVSSVNDVLRSTPNEPQYSYDRPLLSANDPIEEPVHLVNSSSQRLNQARTEPPVSSLSFTEPEPPTLMLNSTRNQQLAPPPIPPKPKTSQNTNMTSNLPSQPPSFSVAPAFEQSPKINATSASAALPKHVQFVHQARGNTDNPPKVKDDPFVPPPRRGRQSYRETNIDEPEPPEISRSVAREPSKSMAVAAQIITVSSDADERRARPPPKILTDANANRPTVSSPKTEIRITLNDEPVPISVASVNASRNSHSNPSPNTNVNASLKIESLLDSATQANTAANSGSFAQPGSRGGPALLASLASLSGRQRSPEETEYERAANAFASTSAVSDTYWQSLLTTIAPNLKSSAAAQSGAAGGFDENEEYYDESEIDNGLEDENSSGRSPSRSHSTKSASDYLDEVFGASPHHSSGTSIGVTSEPFTEHQRSLFNRYNSIRRKLHKAPSTNDDSAEQTSPTRTFAVPGSTGGSPWATVTDPERWREETAARLTTMMALAKRKTEYLRASETDVELDMRANDELGRQIRAVLVRKCAVRAEIDKYDAHVNELDKIIKLLLQLSVRLAKTEQQVRETTDGIQKKALVEKRNRLRIQYEDAKQLKAAMDKRSVAVHQTLTELFTPEEFDEYRLYVEMKAKLVVEHQELQDCLHTADEQLAALRNAQTALSALTAAQIKSLPSSASQHSG